jgi:hypothetical protein
MLNQHHILIDEACAEAPDGNLYSPWKHKKPGSSSPHLTDAFDFFHEITDSYLSLEKQALSIAGRIPHASPEDLHAACTALCQQKIDLHDQDEHMIAILNLAGRELANTPLLYDYRIAFAKASIACNNLYQSLYALKLDILRTALEDLIITPPTR